MLLVMSVLHLTSLTVLYDIIHLIKEADQQLTNLLLLSVSLLSF